MIQLCPYSGRRCECQQPDFPWLANGFIPKRCWRSLSPEHIKHFRRNDKLPKRKTGRQLGRPK